MTDDLTPAWGAPPLVRSEEPCIARGADGHTYQVARGGGPHCAAADDRRTSGCPLPPGHDGDHIPMAEELLTDGWRLDRHRVVFDPCLRCSGYGDFEGDTCRVCGGTGTKRPPARTLKAGDTK